MPTRFPIVILLEIETVLADTAEARRRALLGALAGEGVAVGELEYDDAYAGLPTRAAARAALARHGRAGDETAADLVTLRAERAFADRVAAGGVTLAPGACGFVEEASGRARLAVVTRARRAEADAILALAGIADAFACVVAADDVPDEKPSPAGYQRALARVSRAGGAPVDEIAHHVIALEDALPGIRAARAAGVRCIAVGPLAAHAALEADAAVASLAGQSPASLAALTAAPDGSLGARREERRR